MGTGKGQLKGLLAMWRYLACSVPGEDHNDRQEACQDRREIRLLGNDAHPVLFACVADGAGSASQGGPGAEIACRVIGACAARHFHSHNTCNSLQRADIQTWCDEARIQIEQASREKALPPRQFATTLCAALISPRDALFFQIGDGAIILQKHGAYGAVFWPQSGEFANSTNFLTADNFEKNLEFCQLDSKFDHVALVTDGLERMALCFESHTPFAPFFQPIFDALDQSTDVQNLNHEMQQFLLSQPVRSRSHDDRTIIIATRAS